MAELILRDYQAQLVRDIREAWLRHRSALAWLPTGGGKTEVSVHLAQRETQAGGRTLFVVERKTLAAQARARYATKYGMLVGLLRGEDTHLRGYEPAIVASIQSLKARWERPEVQAVLAGVSLIVIDEAHIRFDHHEDLLRKIPHARVLGLTATPLREGLGLTYNKLVRGPGYDQLIHAGHLIAPRYFLPSTAAVRRGLDGVTISSTGDFVSAELSALMRSRTIVGDVVGTWQEKGEGRPTICFCVDIAHSKATRDAFVMSGVPAEHIDMHTSEEERQRIFGAFRRGEIKVLCSIVVLAVGFDEPSASCAILARPTLSTIMHIQQIGRVMRPNPGKTDCLVLDHAGNVLRHGKVEDFDPPELSEIDRHSDKRRRTARELDYRPCAQCSAMLDPGQRECHECGHVIARPNTVHFVDGQLTEGEPEDAGQFGGKTVEELQALYLELRGYADARGYKPGWPYHQLFKRYGFKAPWDWKSKPPRIPSAQTLRLVQSWRIAWRKAQEKGKAA